MDIRKTFSAGGYGRPFLITIPAHPNTSTDDLLRNAEDAIRPLRAGSSIGFCISVGYAGEPGASAPSIFLTGNVAANTEVYRRTGSVMAELVKVATEVAKYLPACLPVDKKKSIRIQYDDQDIYLGREPAKVEA